MKFHLFLFILLFFTIISCKKEVEIQLPEVSNLHIASSKENLIKLEWTNPPDNEYKFIRISCPDLSSPIELTKGNNSDTIPVPLNNVNYTITVKIIDNNGNESAGKMIVAKAANKQIKGYSWYITMTQSTFISAYEYDLAGRLEKIIIKEYRNDTLNSTITGVYNYQSLPDGGQKITYYQNNTFVSCHIKYYDYNGNVIRCLELNESGAVYSDITYVYDENNRLKSDYAEYNNFNDIISKKYYNSGIEIMTKYEYYPNRLLYNTKMFDDGVYQHISTEFIYDSIGNITTRKVENALGDLNSYHYIY